MMTTFQNLNAINLKIKLNSRILLAPAKKGKPEIKFRYKFCTKMSQNDPKPAAKVKSVKAKWKKSGHFWREVYRRLVDVVFGMLGRYVKRLFTCPLVKDPIYFECGDPNIVKLLNMENLYDNATQEFIQSVFEERKDKIKGREPLNWQQKLDLDQFKGWTQEEVVLLREEFEGKDPEKTGNVDFNALCKTLDRIGNKRLLPERQVHFNAVDKDRSGMVNFEEFSTLIYNLENSDKDLESEAISDLYRHMNREANIIRGMSVIEQLQSGLF